MELVTYRLEGPAIIGLNRPEKRNAIGSAVIEALKLAVLRAGDEADAGVIHGHGANFSAGLDLAEFAEHMGDERVAEMAKRYPGINVDKFHIDILTAHFVQRPEFFDVVVASNLFGDILSDLGPACTGTIGIAPSANLTRIARCRRCSSRCMVRRRTSRAGASQT